MASLSLIYRDKDCLVVDKTPAISIHNQEDQVSPLAGPNKRLAKEDLNSIEGKKYLYYSGIPITKTYLLLLLLVWLFCSFKVAMRKQMLE